MTPWLLVAGDFSPLGGMDAANHALDVHSDAFEANIIVAVRKMIASADPTCYAAICRTLAQTDLTPDLHAIRCPTLIVSADMDPGVDRESQRTLKNGIAKSTHITVSKCSHLIPIERAADFNTDLLNFLAMCNY